MQIKYLVTIVSLLSVTHLKTNMSPEGFERFPNYYFVETGTYGGAGIDLALRTNHYTEIHSLEISPRFVSQAKARFRVYKHVHVHQGDSGKYLWKVIKNMNKPITFWLDGHRGTPDPNGGKNTPLLQELDQIKRHSIKTHTIVIDDMHCCNTELFDFIDHEQIISKIMEINPNYTIYYVDGGGVGEYPDNIMVAQVLH